MGEVVYNAFPQRLRVRIEVDLVGPAAERFRLLLAEMNKDDPAAWTPTQLASSIINEVLLDDAAAHGISLLN